MNDKNKIRNAFNELRKRGWFARMNFWCCQSCGCAAVPQKYENKYVFYHKQDAEAINEDGDIGREMVVYLTHGEGGNTTEILEVLNKHGLDVEWDGDMGTRIMVRHKAEIQERA